MDHILTSNQVRKSWDLLKTRFRSTKILKAIANFYVLAIGFAGLIYSAKKRLKFFRVKGESMSPTLEQGDIVIGALNLPVKKTDLIVFKEPLTELLVIKRVTEVFDDGFVVEVKGDNYANSIDSKNYGPVSLNDPYYKVICVARKNPKKFKRVSLTLGL